MDEYAKNILRKFLEKSFKPNAFIHFTDFDDAIMWRRGAIEDDKIRNGLIYLINNEYVLEMSAGLQLTEKGYNYIKKHFANSTGESIINSYRIAQRAMADLKTAVYSVIKQGPEEGLTNAEIGKALGIYMGHVGHEGHISRTILGLLELEGMLLQDSESKKWSIKK